MKKTKMDLFLELAKPDSMGFSRWVNTAEFSGSWCRASSDLAKKYILEFDKTKSAGNAIDAIRLKGLNTQKTFNNAIRKDIKDFYKDKKCVMLGVCGKSENTKIEIDHKDGRKDNHRISDIKQQKLEDFQPLCKAANDVKRQICKVCKETNKRWNATNIVGNPYAFYAGDENYTQELGCIGCYQYDPVAYRKETIKKIAQKAAEIISKELYGDENL